MAKAYNTGNEIVCDDPECLIYYVGLTLTPMTRKDVDQYQYDNLEGTGVSCASCMAELDSWTLGKGVPL